jgi:hypothetical protein
VDRRTGGSYIRSFPALKHVAFGIACAFGVFFLQGNLIWAFRFSDGLLLLIFLPQPIVQVFIGFWIGSRAARFAWLLAPIPSFVLASVTVPLSLLIRSRGLEELLVAYLVVILLWGVPSLVGGLAGHFWRLFRLRKAGVDSAN